MSVRHDLLDAFRAGLAAVNGDTAVAAALRDDPIRAPSVSMVAVGKAAAAMARGASQALGHRLQRGLVITPAGYTGELLDDDRLTLLESAHPVPDERSVRAGEALVRFIAHTPRTHPVLVLISGGTSSLVELPAAGVDIAQIQKLNRHLLAMGYDIATMNAARQCLSRIKGGRLAHWLDGRHARVLAISDVAGDAPHVIGSGLLAPDPRPQPLPQALRAWLGDWLRAADAPRTPDASVLRDVDFRIVADNALARGAAARVLSQRGYRVDIPETLLTGDIHEVRHLMARHVRTGDAGVTIWGGEPTVVLPTDPGRGGRMQALAALLADDLAGQSGWHLCAAGTDGADGNTPHAGALVDGTTAGRLPPGKLGDCIARADVAECLERAEAVVDTGPTGTNVMDLMILAVDG